MKISSLELIQLLSNKNLHLIDVRSEREFQNGHLPQAINIPILNNDHRHLVGICYKEKGQAEAIKLGHQLVDPKRDELVTQWSAAAQNQNVYVHCWRGGLRSQISSQWMKEASLEVTSVEGGYKAVRNELLKEFKRQHSFLMLTGLTGSGKTDLLQTFQNSWYIDLERIANHRGSAFGVVPGIRPSQQTFENQLALELTRHQSEFLLEDESRKIGGLKIPDDFFAQMQAMPYIVVQREHSERVEEIYQEYIAQSTLSRFELIKQMNHSLQRIKVRLGGARFKKLSDIMARAFELNSSEKHHEWIEELLEHYYDPPYAKRISKIKDKIIFSGSHKEVYEFISDRFSRSRSR